MDRIAGCANQGLASFSFSPILTLHKSQDFGPYFLAPSLTFPDQARPQDHPCGFTESMSLNVQVLEVSRSGIQLKPCWSTVSRVLGCLTLLSVNCLVTQVGKIKTPNQSGVSCETCKTSHKIYKEVIRNRSAGLFFPRR